MAEEKFNKHLGQVNDNTENDTSIVAPKNFTIERPYPFKMIFVKGGTFNMGSNNIRGNESPIHSVTLSDFYIGETQVTQGLWEAVMGENPSFWRSGGDYSVDSVSWNGCQSFIKKLNEETGMDFRLPTEAEWEYAARSGGKEHKFSWTDEAQKGDSLGTTESNRLKQFAWFTKNSKYNRHTVASKEIKPNELGIYDMSGNVWEWCHDLYERTYYSYSPKDNPQGPESGGEHVLRGGSYCSRVGFCRVSYRGACWPDDISNEVGFRLALSPQIQ